MWLKFRACKQKAGYYGGGLIFQLNLSIYLDLMDGLAFKWAAHALEGEHYPSFLMGSGESWSFMNYYWVMFMKNQNGVLLNGNYIMNIVG